MTIEGMGEVLFCHATPLRDDEEVVLVDSRLDRWREVFDGLDPAVRTVVRGAPSDALESEERRALLASRARQARGREIGVPHAEAFRRVFGEEP
ncbi:hypothetical protein [Streptomyces calidiresistens]|uniref:hypothetical protein n=1 Tax=Streptomyces calidiresistens TaxID=1485586 RepID=UPI003F68EFC0